MELDITKCSVVCCGTPDEKKAVLPVECSMILPDYYPDVMKILRYSAGHCRRPFCRMNPEKRFQEASV